MSDDEILARTEPFRDDEQDAAREYLAARSRRGSLYALQALIREKLADTAGWERPCVMAAADDCSTAFPCALPVSEHP